MSDLFRWITGDFTAEESRLAGEPVFSSRRLDYSLPSREDELAVERDLLLIKNAVLRSELVLLR